MKKKRYECSCGWEGNSFQLSWQVVKGKRYGRYRAWGTCPQAKCSYDLEKTHITEKEVNALRKAKADIFWLE